MSTRLEAAPSPRVRSRADLAGWIAAGCKPKEAWRIGTEHEKFVFHTDTLGLQRKQRVRYGFQLVLRT